MEHGDSGSLEDLDSAPESESPSLAPVLQQALLRRLRESIGTHQFSGFSQLASWQAGLATGVSADLLNRQLLDLRPRLKRPDSAIALALNSFLPWLDYLDILQLTGVKQFLELNFDTRCPTGVRGTPPHIELVASGQAGVVGVTVRVFEYLAMRQSSLSAAYTTLAVPASLAPWASLMRMSQGDPASYRYVDVAALSKLAIGLGRIFAHRPVRLLYVFLEPMGTAATLPFAQHRAELARLVEHTRDSAVPLVACSFHELWEEWCAGETPPALRAVAMELRHRYAVVMPH